MTPAIKLLEKIGQDFRTHEYSHDRKVESYGEEAAEKLGISPGRVFKTLVVSSAEARLAVAILPVSTRLSLKKLAKALGTRKCEMADPAAVQRKTGYVLGGVSPLGQKSRLPTVLDTSATSFETVFVSAGRRGLEIELSPALLASLTDGTFASITG